MEIGQEKDIEVKFPEDYHAQELKGKDAVFAVKVHGIKRKSRFPSWMTSLQRM